jgi:hypothetical protein
VKTIFFSGDDHCYCVPGLRAVSFTWTFSLAKKNTINVQYYSTLLSEKIKLAIISKRRKRQDSVCYLQGNAYLHTAALTMAAVLKLKWDALSRAAYDSGLAESGYGLLDQRRIFFRRQDIPE